MVDAFTKPIFALAKGELSKPLVTPFGVHIAKVTEVEPGRVGLDVIRSRVEKTVAARIVRDLLSQALPRLPRLPGRPPFAIARGRRGRYGSGP